MKDEDLVKFMLLPEDKAIAIVEAGEARGEILPNDAGRNLIGSIVLNRAEYGAKHHGWGKLYGNTVHTVIAAKDQFTCLSSNDKNYKLLSELINNFNNALNKYSWLPKIYTDAECVLSGSIARVCKGIFYETLTCNNLFNQFKKRDGKDPEIEIVIGNHRVYKTI